MKKILIVDDDASLCEVLSLALKHAGFEVQGSTELEEAKTKIVSYNPDLIILDLLIPGNSQGGSEILCFLREKGFIKTPVIIITGHYTHDPDFEQTLRQQPNVVDFMKKPFNPVDLAVKIRSQWSGGRSKSNTSKRKR